MTEMLVGAAATALDTLSLRRAFDECFARSDFATFVF
jgi:hypothetical protein